MKPFKTILAGLFAATGVFFAIPASAQPIDGPSTTKFGVTCTQRINGIYPENGHFYYCGSNTAKRDAALAALHGTLNFYPLVNTNFVNRNANFYMFTNAVDDGTFAFPGNPPNNTGGPTTVQKQGFYSAQPARVAGYTTGPISKITLYENVTTGVYPNYASTADGELQFTVMHEMGHLYDFNTDSQSYSLSTSPYYNNLTNTDQAYLTATATTPPTAAQLRANVNIKRIIDPDPADKWVELFAEEFATKASFDISIGLPSEASTAAVVPYFECSRAFVHARMKTGGNPIKADFDALSSSADPQPFERCSGPIICYEQGITLNNYPLDGNNVNGATHAYRCNNAATGVKPSDARNNELFVSSLQTLPANVKNKLKGQNAKYFYFNNRDEANQYFTWIYGTSSSYISSTAICANTAVEGGNGANIIVSVYDNCSYTSGKVLNPNLKLTAHHETGEAFGIALQPTDPKFATAGFNTLFVSDRTALTPPNWSTMSQAQRYSYVCAMYSVNAPSTLEIQYGANLNGKTTAPIGAVCTGSTPAPFYQPIAKTPTVIAFDKLPMFMGSTRELWAEVFVVIVDSSTAPTSYLPMVDRVIGQNQSPTRSFNCTRGVVQNYINTLLPLPATAPVGQMSLQSLGCNQNPGPL